MQANYKKACLFLFLMQHWNDAKNVENQFLISVINNWGLLQIAFSLRAFHKISSEHEMKWKLNAVERLIPNTPSTSSKQPLELFTAPRWLLASLHFSFRINLETAIYTSVCREHAQAHGPCPSGWGLGPSGSSREGRWHTAELMEYPMLRSSQTGWEYWTLTPSTCRKLRPARLLSFTILTLLFGRSLCCYDAMTLPMSWKHFHVHKAYRN